MLIEKVKCPRADICVMQTTIPKIFHQICLNGGMPESHKYFREQMLELHPGWEYKFWTEKNRPRLFNEAAYHKFTKIGFKADLIRYEVLLKYGGVYVDTDYLFLKNIEPCMQKELLLIEGFERPAKQLITNCLMGATPSHPLMKYIVMKIPEMMLKYDEMAAKDGSQLTTGLKLIEPAYIDNYVMDIKSKELS